MATVDLDRLYALATERYLRYERHPTSDLVIWNYTPKTQYDRHWIPETRMCRGLITRADGTVVARPFEKFFSLDEHGGPIPDEPFDVFEKLDGSLGVVYWPDDGDRPSVATRGSFVGKQAVWGTEILHRAIDERPIGPFARNRTYLLEIIHPAGRVVVDYGDLQELVLLAVRDTETGRDLPLEEIGLRRVEQLPGGQDIAALIKLAAPNREGFVVRFESGLRLKVKFADYVRLHRLLYGMNTRALWEHLTAGNTVDELVRSVPEAFDQWVRTTATAFANAYREIEERCRADFARTDRAAPRRETAAYYQSCPYPSVLFKMLDGREHSDLIWKSLRPEQARAFKEQDEDAA